VNSWALLIGICVTMASFIAGSSRAKTLGLNTENKLHSLPVYHGLISACLTAVTVVLALIAAQYFQLSLFAACAGVAISGTLVSLFCFLRVSADYRARTEFEYISKLILFVCAAVAVLATIGIFASVVFESISFFQSVNPVGFLFGSNWAPNGTPPSFGFVPLLVGTLLITAIAVGVATPIGLMSAIYMSEYASPRLRSVAKPLLEMLAGIPTVVLGFFAALTVAPLIRNSGEAIGLSVASESALAAGLVMGMMIVPLISSLGDDIINSVPQSLRDGSFAMGATKSETIKRVVLPAALPGIVSAIMLAISRAIGETMIVVMAAGLAANLSFNPLSAVSTITVQIATLLVGDQEFDSPKTLSAFALGLTLFFFTLALNYLALRVVQKYRQQYD
jgi:phosphate transport system permease protein